MSDKRNSISKESASSSKIKVNSSYICPSCGNDTLFIDDFGNIVCSFIGCKNPTLVDDILTNFEAKKDLDELMDELCRL